MAYKSLVRQLMEYGAARWDPYRENQIDALERLQRRAAKFIRMGPEHEHEKVKREGKELDWEFSLKPLQGIRDRMDEPTRYGRADHYFKINTAKDGHSHS